MTKDERIARLTTRCLTLTTYYIRERKLGDIGRGHAHHALRQAQAIARTIQSLKQLTTTAKDGSHGPR